MLTANSCPIPPALRPPPNTPLTPTFPTSLAPFTLSLSTSYEDTSASCVDHDADDEETDPHTVSSYGLLTPSESYITPPSPSTSSSPLSSCPKRYPHGCLRLRPPIRRPPLPNRIGGGTFSGYGYGGHGGWSCPRVVIGSNDSVPSSHLTPNPAWKTKSAYPGYLRSPSSPTSPSASPTSCRPSPSPNSPAPLPIRLRPIPPPLTHSRSLSGPISLPAHLHNTTSDLTSDSETEVEPELEEEGDGSASDTCASDSDSENGDGSGYSNINGKTKVLSMLISKPRSTKLKSTKRLPIPRSAEDEEAETVVA